MKRAIAIVSDIHSNLEALRAVLSDIREQGVREIYCLGDVIGYGPNPCECIDLVAGFHVCVLGNHDQAALFDPDGFNPVALGAVYWTREKLESGPGNTAKINKRWDFLGELPRTYVEDDILLVHGSPREPTNEYVFPEDVYNRRKLDNLFGRISLYCFQGHTHIPGIFRADGEFIGPDECDHRFQLNGEKTMVNVGSVGQPRDGDRRSCYVILDDDDVIAFRRVEYPVEVTRDKIHAVEELDNMLGDRLLEGR